MYEYTIVTFHYDSNIITLHGNDVNRYDIEAIITGKMNRCHCTLIYNISNNISNKLTIITKIIYNNNVFTIKIVMS